MTTTLVVIGIYAGLGLAIFPALLWANGPIPPRYRSVSNTLVFIALAVLLWPAAVIIAVVAKARIL